MTITIGGTEWASRVLAGSYNVNQIDITNEWQDANMVTHRSLKRHQVTGSFDMAFKDWTEYQNFLTSAHTYETGELTVACTVSVNNLDADYTGSFYLSFTPIRNRNANWEDVIERFKVTITEA